jgi:hypothetical protein
MRVMIKKVSEEIKHLSIGEWIRNRVLVSKYSYKEVVKEAAKYIDVSEITIRNDMGNCFFNSKGKSIPLSRKLMWVDFINVKKKDDWGLKTSLEELFPEKNQLQTV